VAAFLALSPVAVLAIARQITSWLPPSMVPSVSARSNTSTRPIARDDPAFARVTAAFFLGGFATFALLYSVQPLLPLFARDFDVSPAIASLSLSLATGVMAPALIIAGSASEVWGRKHLMVGSLAASSVATMFAALARDWTILLLLRALTGLALSGLPAVAMAYLADQMSASALGLAMGQYIAGSTLGGMASRLAASILADHWGWRVPIAASGVEGLLGAVFLAYALPRERVFAHVTPDLRGLARSLAAQFADPGLRLLFAEGFLVMGTLVCTYNYIGFRLAAPPFSLSQTTIGFVFALYLVGAASSAVMGELAGRLGRRRVLWIAASIELVGVAATLPDNLVAIIAGVTLITWGFFRAHSIASSWVGLRAPVGRAQATALYLFFYYLGSSLAGSAGGWFFARWAWPGVVGMLGALVGAALLIALRLSKVPPPRHLQIP
jgi:MFS transporter, YNFM family, putative membrane transport protein